MNKFVFHFCLISLLLSSHSYGMDEEISKVRSGRRLPTLPKTEVSLPAQNKVSSPPLKLPPPVPQKPMSPPPSRTLPSQLERPLLPAPKRTLPTPPKTDTALTDKKIQPRVPPRPMSPQPTTPLFQIPPARPLSPPPTKSTKNGITNTGEEVKVYKAPHRNAVVYPFIVVDELQSQKKIEKTLESAEMTSAPGKSSVDPYPTKQKQRPRRKTESEKSSKSSNPSSTMAPAEAPADLQKRPRANTIRNALYSVTAILGNKKKNESVEEPVVKEGSPSLLSQSPKIPYYKQQGTYSKKTKQLMETEGLDKPKAESIAKITNLYGSLVDPDAPENESDPIRKLLGQIKPTSKVQIKQLPEVKDQDPQNSTPKNTDQSKN